MRCRRIPSKAAPLRRGCAAQVDVSFKGLDGSAGIAGILFRQPECEAAASRRPVIPALTPQILPGIFGGVAAGILLFISLRLSPAAIAGLQGQFTPPLYARVPYGGITEEVLLRWGLMTVLAWLAWRFVQGKRGAAGAGLVWLGIVASALLFGIGHLPVASYLVGSLTAVVVFFVVGVNAAFGLLFGWLYWRRGLESAMIAHALTHLVSYVATQVAGSAGAA